MATRKKAKGHHSPGEGSITQRKDGLYVGRLYLGKDVQTGKVKRWQKTSMERWVVEEALAKAVKDHRRGRQVGHDQQTLAEFLDDWLETAIKGKPAKTYSSYKQMVITHIKPALGDLTLAELTPQHVAQMLAQMRCHDRKGKPTDRPASARTKQYARAILRSALNRAVRWEILDRNAAELSDPPHVDKTPVVPLTPESALTLLAVIRGHPLEALYSVALAIGLRQGEALGLRWDDVDLEAAQLRTMVSLERVDGTFRLKDLKNHRRGRVIALPRFAVAALRERLRIQKEERVRAAWEWKGNALNLVFTTSIGTPLDRHNVSHQWERFLARAKLPHARFYDLRHTCASLLLAQGVPLKVVSEILGHSTITLTADTYSHLGPAQYRDAADRMDSVLGHG